jgi:hypothetical protein
MTTLETVPQPTTLTPSDVARDVMGTIKKIEKAIEDSNGHIGAIEDRGWVKNWLASSREDLIAVSKSQTKINELMLGIIQDVITLNVMSYSFLAAVIDEFRQMTAEGWKENDGRVQRLSKTGKEFAETASNIFVKIVEGSRVTHEAIELNTKDIGALRQHLALKQQTDVQQSREIAALSQQLADKATQISLLGDDLAEKSRLDEHQSNEIRSLGKLLQEVSANVAQISATLAEKERVDGTQEQRLGQLDGVVSDLSERQAAITTRLGQLEVHLQNPPSMTGKLVVVALLTGLAAAAAITGFGMFIA